MMEKTIFIFIILSLLLTVLVVGQSLNASKSIEDIKTEISSNNVPYDAFTVQKAMMMIYLSLGVLVFGLVLVIFTGIIALRKNTGWDQEVTRMFTLSVIVTAGLFLMTAGYSDQQIAPMFGLLGTIIGYLFGKAPPKEENPKSEL